MSRIDNLSVNTINTVGTTSLNMNTDFKNEEYKNEQQTEEEQKQIVANYEKKLRDYLLSVQKEMKNSEKKSSIEE